MTNLTKNGAGQTALNLGGDAFDRAAYRDELWWSSYFGQFDKFFSCRLMLESNG
jgi:hypothetical protein